MANKRYKFFKELTDEEEVEYREWARNNYEVGELINSCWHPIVIDECFAMVIEQIKDNENAEPERMGGEDGSGDEDSDE